MFSQPPIFSRPLRRGGSTLLIVIVVMALVGLLMPSLLRSFAIKSQNQNDYRNSDAMEGIVRAVAHAAVGELRIKFAQNGPGPWAAAQRYSNLNRRIFPKGDPSFLVQEYQFDGSSFVNPVSGVPQPKFRAPETDPQVWIERFGTGIGNNVYSLRIQMTVCRISLSGRAVPAAPTYNLGIAWAPACPVEHQIPVNYTGLVLRANL